MVTQIPLLPAGDNGYKIINGSFNHLKGRLSNTTRKTLKNATFALKEFFFFCVFIFIDGMNDIANCTDKHLGLKLMSSENNTKPVVISLGTAVQEETEILQPTM